MDLRGYGHLVMRIQFAVSHKRDQPIGRADSVVEIARCVFGVYVLSETLEVRSAHFRHRPRGRRYHALGTVRGEITKQSAI